MFFCCRFNLFFLGFNLPENVTSSAIHAVSLSTHPCEYGSKARLLPEKSENNTFKSNFTICLSPIFGYYKNVNQLVNFIEMHRLLGVNKVAVYNYSISSEVGAYLEMYKSKGIVDIYQWNLPEGFDAYYRAQRAMLSDCLYRSGIIYCTYNILHCGALKYRDKRDIHILVDPCV